MRFGLSTRSFVVSLFFLITLPAQNANAWHPDQHRWIVSDAVQYMADSGDELLAYVADWLNRSTGSNNLLRDPGSFWYEPEECRPENIGSYPAICALRNEAGNA